jgi:hypothetical protein
MASAMLGGQYKSASNEKTTAYACSVVFIEEKNADNLLIVAGSAAPYLRFQCVCAAYGGSDGFGRRQARRPFADWGLRIQLGLGVRYGDRREPNTYEYKPKAAFIARLLHLS